ncbi:SDR family oxidoreductase [Glycomyces arizonensis]|uniref:SDR family oxidoreductase n=1 Tax=Glycomyces arizonensis TaxID=256035 RepID=UPI00041B2255|nr:SDR family oxidoreductase [Glycomyces arizonensis]
MRVFVTGATGWIGSALVPELIAAGHDVVGLARSDAGAAALDEAGAEALRGSLDDLDVLRKAAVDADGVVHLAFKHDVAFGGDFPAAGAADRAAIEVFGEALAGTGRPLVIASGMLETAVGELATERDHPDPAAVSVAAVRFANAQATLDLAERGVRASVVRLPPTVHGDGDNGFVPALVGVARTMGVSGYIGDGAARWAAVHRSDAATLFRLAVEKAPAGSVLHAVGDEGVPTRAIAEAIARHLGVPAASVAPEDAYDHFGWVGAFAGNDRAASGAITRELLGWEPTGPGLLADLDQGHYFAERS